jgi:hypothetical protein
MPPSGSAAYLRFWGIGYALVFLAGIASWFDIIDPSPGGNGTLLAVPTRRAAESPQAEPLRPQGILKHAGGRVEALGGSFALPDPWPA